MKKIASIAFILLSFFVSCKKKTGGENNNKKLYPLADGNKWIYVDSFFNEAGHFYGLDTFVLKTAKAIQVNQKQYIPITDQFDDSIFIIHSTDSMVLMLKRPAESLLYLHPLSEVPTTINNSYFGDTINSKIFTQRITGTAYPSYKILITYDDGSRINYKQQELYFTAGLGIIKGRDIRKNRAGNFYAYDSYRLVSYSLY